MSHHDHDDHHHNDGHAHAHSHSHHHDHAPAEMSFPEKMIKLLDHWIKHNDEHAKTYKGWADQARQNHLGRAALLIEEAAAMNLAVNEKFEQARALVDKK
ncbi:MAG: hypothetical protein C4518_16675 [Desulfobacteraceae bacterium]|nr:MAG: hypothetical protein C4518_16675 [Desulfobacteraceae bacterium]